jgi:YidC/Oxa1 family membrane protein insertase
VSQIWNSILDAFESALAGLEQLLSFTGAASWGWAIIALTVVVRIVLLPLAIKQIRSMRAMQAIQPQMKAIQKKYKVDRDLMKKDPDQYKAKKQKQNEEMMALYQAEGVNPAASCLPLIAQAPVFFALFSILRGERADELAGQSFYFVTSQVPEEGLTALVSAAGPPGWLLVVLMAATMFLMQKQMMARQAATGADNPMAQQQKILLYVMPVFLAVISFSLPLGVLLYWVTTNAWQAGQQAIMLREVRHEVEEGTLADHPGGEAAAIDPGKKGKRGRRARTARTTGRARGRPAPAPATRPPGGGTPARPAAARRRRPNPSRPRTSPPRRSPRGRRARAATPADPRPRTGAPAVPRTAHRSRARSPLPGARRTATTSRAVAETRPTCPHP